MEISKTEYQVLEAIWATTPCKANEVIDYLNQSGETWHEKTVKTLIGRLVKKEAISFKKEGRIYVYQPLVSRFEYQAKESSSFISRLFQGKVSPLVATFAKKNKLTKTDVDELKQIIENWEKNND